MRIVIGTPSNGLVHARHMLCMSNLVLYSKGRVNAQLVPVSTESSIVANSRNQIVDAAKHLGAEKVLMIDSDIMFNYDVLERLLSHAKEIVGGLYKRRSPPHEVLGTPVDRRAGDRAGLIEMEVLPTGCILIDMSVFRVLQGPRETAAVPAFRFGEEDGKIVGEDVQFSRDARAAGFRLWADCDIPLGHISSIVLE